MIYNPSWTVILKAYVVLQTASNRYKPGIDKIKWEVLATFGILIGRTAPNVTPAVKIKHFLNENLSSARACGFDCQIYWQRR